MNKYPWYYWFSWLWTLPWNILAWAAVLFLRVVAGGKIFWRGGLWLSLKEDSWFVRGPYSGWGGTTFGNGGILRKRNVGDEEVIDTRTEYHESIHEEQFEVVSLMMFILFVPIAVLTGIYWFLLPAWFIGYPLLVMSGGVQARLRGERVYRGSQHEEAAYAAATLFEEKKRGL